MKGDDPFPMFSLGNAEEIETAQPIENVTGQLSGSEPKIKFSSKIFFSDSAAKHRGRHVQAPRAGTGNALFENQDYNCNDYDYQSLSAES